MESKKLNRRQFLKVSGATAAVAATVATAVQPR